MSHAYFENEFVLREVKITLRKGHCTILDAGCGKGVYGYLTRCEAANNIFIIGLDIHGLEFVKKYNIYDDVVMADVTHLPFREKSFDLVISSQVIEHLSKSAGLDFLKETGRVYKGRIIFATPNGYLPSADPKSDLDIHRTGWHVRDFKKRGFRVNGIGFKLINLYSSHGHAYLYAFLRHIFTPVSYIFPQFGEILIAVRDYPTSSNIPV